MHQLYHTTCSESRGTKRSAGFGVLAASCSADRELPLEIKEIAPYPFTLIRMGVALPARWVWQKTSNGSSLLMRCVYLGAGPDSGIGTHFSHIVFDIAPDRGLQEILGACAFPFWKQAHAGSPTLPTVYNLPPGAIFTESQVSIQAQNPEWNQVLKAAVALCLYDGSIGGWNQMLLPAENDAVFNLLQLLVRVLPNRISKELTFSTLEQKEGLPLRIVGIPRALLEMKTSSQTAVSLLQPEAVWNGLPQFAQDYATWCIDCAADNDWDEIHRFLSFTDQCGVETASQLKMIWRLCKATDRLDPDEISQLLDNRELAPLVLENTRFLSRAREIALSEPLDRHLLKRLHRHEKSHRQSRKTAVEEALIEAAVLAAEPDQPARLREVLETLSSFHRVSSDNLEYGFHTPDFGDRVRDILKCLNQRMLSAAASKCPSLSYRLELFSYGRIWLTEEFQRGSMEHWLRTDSAEECLGLVEFLKRDCHSDASSGLIVRTLSCYFHNLKHDLASEPRLLEWLWSCPVQILAQSLTLVEASQASRLSEIWHGAAFRKDDFFSAPVNSEYSTHFESAYDVARAELIPDPVRHSIRSGNRTFLERDPGIPEADIVRFAVVELLRELSQPGESFNIQVANDISWVACANNSIPFIEVVYSLELKWSSVSPPAAAWLMDRLFVNEALEERRPSEWISELSDAALTSLLKIRHERARVIAVFYCLQRDLPLQASHFEFGTFAHLLERIAQAIVVSHGQGYVAESHQLLKQTIDGLVRSVQPDFLIQPKIMDLIIWHAATRRELLPLLESILISVPEETLVNHYQIPDRKIQWEKALRVVEQYYAPTVPVIRSFVCKLIYVEMCNPWLRMSNSSGLTRHIDYPRSDDALTRRMAFARFLVSEDGEGVPPFAELLITLQEEEYYFQNAFFCVLRQAGDAAYKKLLKPFRATDLDRSVPYLYRRFDELFQLWQNDLDYMRMVGYFAVTLESLFSGPNGIASALFPLIRYTVVLSHEHRIWAQQLIANWSRQDPNCSPNEIYWQLRDSCVDLNPDMQVRFLELCEEVILGKKGGRIPDRSFGSERSWFRFRRKTRS